GRGGKGVWGGGPVGACVGCPMSIMTLKAGIERILRERVPGVTDVEAV
ncbi:MAG: hypothetical protein DIU76_08475, partial [Bacillota bacterium]